MADAIVTKVCSACNQALPVERFGASPLYRDGRRGQCTPCRAKRNKKRQARRCETRRYKLKSRYGLTPDDYSRMLEAQGGGCGLCRSKDPKSRWHRFHFDHCHETGKVRGLLCNPCNVLIGKFNDDAELFQRFADYLR